MVSQFAKLYGLARAVSYLMFIEPDVRGIIGPLGEEKVWYEREALALNVALPRLRLILLTGCHNKCNSLPWF